MANTNITPLVGAIGYTARLAGPASPKTLQAEVLKINSRFLGVEAIANTRLGVIEVHDDAITAPKTPPTKAYPHVAVGGLSELGWTIYLPGEAAIAYGVPL